MFSIQILSDKIDELKDDRLDFDTFEDWFVSESWGYYDVHGGPTSDVIAAVHHILHRYDADEIDEPRAAKELAKAIRPFVSSNRIRCSHTVRVHTAVKIVEPHPRRAPANVWSGRVRVALAQ